MVISLFYGIFSTLINKNNFNKKLEKMKFLQKTIFIFFLSIVGFLIVFKWLFIQ